MSYIIRDAQKEDMPSVLNLITELAVFEKEPDAVDISVSDLERDGFSTPPKFKCFVAEEENTIIGVALIYDRYSTWKGISIHLEDLIVTENKRNLGVGKALYTTFLKYADARSVKRVSWEVLDWNTNAINFYTNTGASILSDWKVVHMNQKKIQEFLENK